MNRRRALVLAPALAWALQASAGGLQRHFYATSEETSLASLRKNAGELDLASPQWFEIDGSGRLVARVDDAVVSWARARKLSLMPLILNQEFRPEIARLILTDLEARAALICDLQNAGARWRLRGFQLDLENVPAEARAALTDFVRVAASQLKKRGLRLSVAVPAPLWTTPRADRPDPVNERSKAFDYRALGAAADFLTVMTYDQHTSPDDPGPVAGQPWVRACLERVLAEVPAKRVMLGVPLYYRRFKDGPILEGPHAEAVELALSHGASIATDAVELERTFSFVEAGERNVVWLQDAETLRKRLELARRFRLAGFSAWRLGQEDPAAWPYLSGRR